MNYWFMSDLHLSHENLRVFLNRPFKSIDEMDEIILNNISSNIRGGDYFYFLGDLAWRSTAYENFFAMIKKSRIQLFFIYGNHDSNVPLKYLNQCVWHGSLKDIKINNQKITLCHYMMKSWNCSHHGAWHLHGHHHTDVSNIADGKVMNVCADLNNFMPIHFDTVSEYMKTRKENWNMLEKYNQ